MAVWIEFDWDTAKAAANLKKHNVVFDDAMTVFDDPLALSSIDSEEGSEERWVTVDLNRSTKLLLAVHTYVELSHEHLYLRIISARKPTKNERRDYEQAPCQS